MNRPLSDEDIMALRAGLRNSAEDFELGGDLRTFDVMARLASEFWSFLLALRAGPVEVAEVRYACESVFSGIDCFCQLSAYCRILGSGGTDGAQDITSVAEVDGVFAVQLERLLSEPLFPEQCRLLRELFRLQLFFATLTYA